MPRVLLTEDDDDLAFALTRLLNQRGYDVAWAATAAQARATAAKADHDLVVMDLGLPDEDGHDLLRGLLAGDPTIPVLVLTARDEAASAIKAIRLGATDYLTKPVESETLFSSLAAALEQSTLRRSLEAMRRQSMEGEGIVGSAPAFQRAMRALGQAAGAAHAPVLITGETGTGKELAARFVHRASPRSGGPFVVLNAACLPKELVESELFGHEAGAFTGAKAGRRGLFELASGGTLFLDEIGELPLDLQPKLLRVIEGHPFRRVGGEREIRADVRIVAATHRELAAFVEAGQFRQDLYFRLKVLGIHLPPLRERVEDIPLLVECFLSKFRETMGTAPPACSGEAMAALARYRWPGNIRELRNVIERAIILTPGPAIRIEDLPPEIAGPPAASARPAPQESLEDILQGRMVEAWENSGRNLSQTARTLGVTRVTLRSWLRKAGAYPVKD
ncbi:sigma-54-dependent transcriptional regulator [Geothrix fermentans]|uniref:sigma-54-dependent transcriptional regulator n=1 Tax=Geothrix fermentans TaxID=44676 RepID=UPI000426F849|nr:sigma-54 dependent transcriptional regulator [Geothrix fermentans]